MPLLLFHVTLSPTTHPFPPRRPHLPLRQAPQPRCQLSRYHKHDPDEPKPSAIARSALRGLAGQRRESNLQDRVRPPADRARAPGELQRPTTRPLQHSLQQWPPGAGMDFPTVGKSRRRRRSRLVFAPSDPREYNHGNPAKSAPRRLQRLGHIRDGLLF